MIGNKTICLNMIVKNESHIIIQTLNNLINYINFDYWVISDTGSTDNTKELIVEFFNKQNIPGELIENVWVDFAFNRSEAINHAFNKSDYLFFFDADDSLIGTINFPELTNDIYTFKFGKSITYHRPLLVNNHKKWKYVGVLHEYLVSLEDIDNKILIEGDYYVDSGRVGSRNLNPNKYADDAEVLAKAFDKEIDLDKGLASRYCFYCAQSYKDANNIDKSIEWYKKVLTLDSWNQEKYYSCLMLGSLYVKLNNNLEAIKYYMKSSDYDNERIEGLAETISILKNSEMYSFVDHVYQIYRNYKKNFPNRYPVDRLFLFKHLYNDIIEYNYAFSMYYLKSNLDDGYNCIKQVIINNYIPSNYYISCLDTLYHYKEQLIKDPDTLELFYSLNNYIQYFSKTITLLEILLNMNKTKLYHSPVIKCVSNSDIFISFRCVRSFQNCLKTIFSILNHWSYIPDNWLFINDNILSESEMNVVKANFKFLIISENKNIISEVIKSKAKYWIHLEDNYIFHSKYDYVNEGILGLTELANSNVKQICFNKCYARQFNEYNYDNFISTNNPKFLIHLYYNTVNNRPGYHHWKHFTLKPAITDTTSLFEMDNMDEISYANEWFEKGFRTGFLNSINYTCIEMSNSDSLVVNELGLINNNIKIIKESLFDLPIKIINLERRSDRKEKMIELLNKNNINSFEFVSAIDGKKLIKNKVLIDIFKDNLFESRKGMIGCALSHVVLWTQLVNDENNDYYIILEDDILDVSNDFAYKLQLLNGTKQFQQNDILYLGYLMWSRHKELLDDHYSNLDTDICVRPLNYNLIIGGTFSYSINKSTASKLLSYVETNGIKEAIDNFIINYSRQPNTIMLKEVKPHICFTDWMEYGKEVDTDIQRDMSVFDFNKIYVKMIGHYWNSSSDICNEFNLMKPNNSIIELVDHNNTDIIDYYVIINVPPNDVYFDPEKTLIFPMEPLIQVDKWKEFYDHYPNIKFLGTHDKHLNNVQWRFKLEENSIKLDGLNKIAIILSHKLIYPGHIKRVDFIKKLDHKILDVYGKENYHSLNNYQGTVDYANNVLMKYKYYIMGENFIEHNYATEKIWEPIICECLTFYSGCPNLEDYIDPRAFVRIDFDKPDEAINIIKKAIDEDWWSQRIDIIRKEKQKILNNLGFFPRLEELLN